jgi:TolA-binding protein
MRVRAIWVGGLCLGLMLGPLAGPRPAAAQMQSREGIALQNQILELQHEIQTLAQRGGGGGYGGYPAPAAGYPPGAGASAATSDITARLLTRVDALESAVRELRGQVEQLNNQVQQQTAQLGKRIDDLQFQVQNPATPAAPARAPAAAASPAPSRQAAGPPATPAPPAPGRRTPELSLQEGDAALARHDYAAAEQSARAVLANRASPRAYDAQFLLAEALMGQRQYSQAAIAYDDAYNRQKKGAHAPEALLGLADALVAINEKRAACDTLTKLHAEFPNPRGDLRDRAAQAGKRAACR